MRSFHPESLLTRDIKRHLRSKLTEEQLLELEAFMWSNGDWEMDNPTHWLEASDAMVRERDERRQEQLREIRTQNQKALALEAGVKNWSLVAVPDLDLKQPWSLSTLRAFEAFLTKHFDKWDVAATSDGDTLTWWVGRGEVRAPFELNGQLTFHAATKWLPYGNEDALAVALVTARRHETLVEGRHASKAVWQRIAAMSPSPQIARPSTVGRDSYGDPRNGLTFDALRFVSKLSEALACAVLYDLPRDGKGAGNRVTFRELNFASLQKARVSTAYRHERVTNKVLWGLLAPEIPYFRIEKETLKGFKVKVFRQLTEELYPVSAAKRDMQTTPLVMFGNYRPMFELTRLFGDVGAIRRFVQAKKMNWTRMGLHDAGQFKLPDNNDWDKAAWAALCLRDARCTKYASQFDTLEKAYAGVPRSFSELRSRAVRMSYPDVPEKHLPLLEASLACGLSPAEFKKHMEFWEETKPKTAEFLPHLSIRGESIGLGPQWRIERLASTDFRGPLLGSLTGCCQHLSGQGKDSAIAGVVSPYSAFYVVFKGKDVYAQSWAWRANTGEVVFDSWESVERDPKALIPCAELVKAAAEEMLKSPLGVPAVLMGATDSGITRLLWNHIKGGATVRAPRGSSAKLTPMDGMGYFDGLAQYKIAGTLRSEAGLKRAKRLPKTDGYKLKRQESFGRQGFFMLDELPYYRFADDIVLEGEVRHPFRDIGTPVRFVPGEAIALDPVEMEPRPRRVMYEQPLVTTVHDASALEAMYAPQG